MKVYVDPVRAALLSLVPLAILLTLFAVRYRTGDRSLVDLPFSTSFHAAIYHIWIIALYYEGQFDAATFFIFPADILLRLIHRDIFVGGTVLVFSALVWGFLSSQISVVLLPRLREWAPTYSRAGLIAHGCSMVGVLLCARYAVVYLLIGLPFLYRPNNLAGIGTLNVFMIDVTFLIAVTGTSAALLSGASRGRLAWASVCPFLAQLVLVPLTNALSQL